MSSKASNCTGDVRTGYRHCRRYRPFHRVRWITNRGCLFAVLTDGPRPCVSRTNAVEREPEPMNEAPKRMAPLNSLTAWFAIRAHYPAVNISPLLATSLSQVELVFLVYSLLLPVPPVTGATLPLIPISPYRFHVTSRCRSYSNPHQTPMIWVFVSGGPTPGHAPCNQYRDCVTQSVSTDFRCRMIERMPATTLPWMTPMPVRPALWKTYWAPTMRDASVTTLNSPASLCRSLSRRSADAHCPATPVPGWRALDSVGKNCGFDDDTIEIQKNSSTFHEFKLATVLGSEISARNDSAIELTE